MIATRFGGAAILKVPDGIDEKRMRENCTEARLLPDWSEVLVLFSVALTHCRA